MSNLHFYRISGYWKNDRSKFKDHLVTNWKHIPKAMADKVGDEDIFMYGMSRTEILAAKSSTSDYEFVITKFEKTDL